MRNQKQSRPDRNGAAFLLAQVGARAAQEFGRLLSPLGFTPPEAGILRILQRSPGMSQQELSGRLQMYASRLVAVIDGMEERGLVSREAHPEDRRVYALRLSEKGSEALREIGRVARTHEEVMCAALDEKERSQLIRLLEKIVAQQGLTPGVHPGYRDMGRSQREPESC